MCGARCTSLIAVPNLKVSTHRCSTSWGAFGPLGCCPRWIPTCQRVWYQVLVLVMLLQPIQHKLPVDPYHCPVLLFWWSVTWQTIETVHFSCGDSKSEGTMVQGYWIHVLNHQGLFRFPMLLMTQWKVHLYAYLIILYIYIYIYIYCFCDWSGGVFKVLVR